MKKKQENYNNSKVFLPEGYQGIGTTNKGFNYNSAWNGRWRDGGKMQIQDINSNQPQIKPARGKVEQFLLNLAGGWEESKPQLMKDVPLTDITIGPLLDYISGKSDVPVMPIGNISNSGQLISVGNKARRMLAQEHKWVDQSPNLKKYLETASQRHYPASVYDPEKLGRNTGYSTEISKLSRLSDTNKARIAAHEVGHYYQNAPKEADEWNNLFDFSNLPNKIQKYLKGKPIYESVTPSPVKGLQLDKGQGKMISKAQGNEIRERAAQLKDYIAQKNNIRLDKDFKITEAQLDDAIQNYTLDTGLDNNMTQLLSSLKDKKGLLSLMNKYALGTIPAVAISDYKNGGEIQNYINNTDMIRKGAPSNGKYAKKTKASARDGKMLYFQQGLDFNPKTISANGSELKKLDDLTNWTNYNIPQAEFGLDATTMMRGQNPEFLNTATSKLNFDFNKATTPFQIQQQNGINNNLLPINTGKNSGGQNFMDSIGGIGGGMQIAQNLIGGIQQLGAEKKKRKSAEQWADVSDVVLKAAQTKPEQQERKYIRPEDNINTGSEFFPVYGVGTNVLKDGGEIQNTYAPNTLYKNLEYYPIKAETGMSVDPYGMGADVISKGITAFGGENAGGDIGGTVGKYAGMAIGGPLGAAIGQVGGQIIGGLIDRNPHKTKLAQEHFNKNMQRIGMADGVQQQYSSYMEDGGELKYISNDWLPKTYTSLDEYRSGGNLKADYIAPTERALQTYALGGDIQTHWGGKAEPISYNPFLPEEGETVMFKGQTHDESDGKGRSGIGITFGNNPVEVENNEPAVKLNDGGEENNLVVFGNLQIPKGMLQDKKADGRKFKSYIADLSKTEARQNSLVDNSMKKIDDLNVNTSFDKLKLSSLKANVLGANMKLKEIADKKMNAANLQSAINDTAAEHGLVADDLAKGKITKAKNGTTLKAEGGKELEKISQEDYDKLVGMYNKAKQQGRGKDVEEFQKAFSTLLPNRAKAVLEQYPVTSYGKQKGLPATDLASNYDAIFGQRTEQYLPQIEDALNKEITPIGLKPLPLQPINTKQLDKMKTYTTEDNTPDKQNKFDFLNMAAGLIPYLRPSDTEGLDPRQLAGEMYALSHNQLEPVYAQTIQPELSTPYDISLQDMMPRFEAAKRSVANNPAALAQIEAQEQEYKNRVLGEQFRQNQAMKANVYAQNRNILNEAKLQNMNILAQQQDKQALAKSNTKAVAKAAISSIADKYLQNKLENKTLGIYENLYNYRFDDRGRAINMNQNPNFNIPTVASTDPNIVIPSDYERAKAVVKAYDDKQSKDIKAMSKSVLPKKTRNGDIVKSFKGY